MKTYDFSHPDMAIQISTYGRLVVHKKVAALRIYVKMKYKKIKNSKINKYWYQY